MNARIFDSDIIETQHRQQRDDAELEVLGLMYAARHPWDDDGSTAAAVTIARQEGICEFSFSEHDRRVIFLAATCCRTRKQAAFAAKRILIENGRWEGLWDELLAQLVDAYVWQPHHLQKAARRLHRLERQEYEARECARRYQQLLTDQVEPARSRKGDVRKG